MLALIVSGDPPHSQSLSVRLGKPRLPPPSEAWLVLPDDVPSQIDIDRELSAYEAYVWALDADYDQVLSAELHR